MPYAILRILSVVISVLVPHGILMAERLPTDMELRASYCIPVVRFDADIYSKIIHILVEDSQRDPNPKDLTLAQEREKLLADVRRYLDETRSALRRLQLYMIPRLVELDPTSLVIATARAKEDLELIQKIVPVCEERCIKNFDSECLDECSKQLIPDIRQRFESCRNLSWLPF